MLISKEKHPEVEVYEQDYIKLPKLFQIFITFLH